MSEKTLMIPEATHLMPAMTVGHALTRYNTIVSFVRQVMKDGVDYGTVPGTDKPTLLKPGAEKLTTLFGLTPQFPIVREVEDWDGGTRIADCLTAFNLEWGRRVLAGRSVVILLSDGLERDSAADLDFQAGRLSRSTDELIWLNPMLRFDEFEPLAYGIRTILPHVDRFLPAHNIDSLTGLGHLLSGSHKTSKRKTA